MTQTSSGQFEAISTHPTRRISVRWVDRLVDSILGFHGKRSKGIVVRFHSGKPKGIGEIRNRIPRIPISAMRRHMCSQNLRPRLAMRLLQWR